MIAIEIPVHRSQTDTRLLRHIHRKAKNLDSSDELDGGEGRERKPLHPAEGLLHNDLRQDCEGEGQTYGSMEDIQTRNIHKYTQLFLTWVQKQFSGKTDLSTQSQSDWISTGFKKKNLELSLTPYTKLTSKWITDLNVELKTLNLQKKIRENLQTGKEFLDWILNAQPIKEKLITWTSSKLTAFAL